MRGRTSLRNRRQRRSGCNGNLILNLFPVCLYNTNTPPMESGPRTDAFPAGLRVLAVDDDPAWLKVV